MHRSVFVSTFPSPRSNRRKENSPRLNLPCHSKPLPQILRKHRRRQTIRTGVRDTNSLVVTTNNHARCQRGEVFLLPYGHVLLYAIEDDGGHADAGFLLCVLHGCVKQFSTGFQCARDELFYAGFGGLGDEGWWRGVGIGLLSQGGFEGVYERRGDIGVDEDSICCHADLAGLLSVVSLS